MAKISRVTQWDVRIRSVNRAVCKRLRNEINNCTVDPVIRQIDFNRRNAASFFLRTDEQANPRERARFDRKEKRASLVSLRNSYLPFFVSRVIGRETTDGRYTGSLMVEI